MEEKSFEGFTEETFNFMMDLRFNNNKEWFDENRDRYKLFLKEPTEIFGQELNKALMSLDKDIKTTVVVSRINRDIRFSKNKEPYKDHKWIVFKAGVGPWKNSPAFFFELRAESYTYGMGFYEASSTYMQNFRNKIDANTTEFERLIKPYKNNERLVLEGDKYKRKLTDDKSEAVMDWYQRKSLAIMSNNNIDNTVFSKQFIDIISNGFKPMIPMYKYLMSVSEK